ncbi:ead/Ea22-like family protein [Enterobacter hormaechei]|uniref:ead/Ea22-like family protein n=1 Tax=Enterobacter hormaechei TaxID=158836 RepID=UPI00254CA5BD|nr:ead/Ea22-like family protein [Enterobacter hormaechei]MDK9638444.1 ead/Ea22-like family protein [Enterobacter hormaechei]
MSNIDLRALLGVPKHANQHRLSRLTMEAHSDELRIVASAVESYNDELIAALEAAEKRIAELQNDEVRQRLANAEHQLHMAELAKHNLRASRKAQFRKRKAAEKRIAELEALEVNLPKLSVGEVMHVSGFSRDYAEGWCSGNDNAIHEIHATGVKVAAAAGKGE